MFDPDRRHLIAYVAAAAVLVVIALRMVGGDRGSAAPAISVAAPSPPARSPASRPREPAAAGVIWVDVAGAVRRPGLYSLPKDARIATALRRAGGVTRRAERAAVNLAAKLADGQQVFVPARVGAAARTHSAGAAAGSAGAASAGAGSTGAASAGAGSTGAASTGAASGGRSVSLSTATQAELETLEGIGPALAARIIEYREQNGGFRSIDQLREVSGIGDKRFEALEDSISP